MTITSFDEWLAKIDSDAEDITVDRDELYSYTKEGIETFDGNNRADLLWRMGRAAFKVAGAAEIAKDVEKQKKYLADAEEWSKKAVALEPENADAHLWLANIYGKMSDHLGTKERIGKGKAHLEACIKSRPDDFNAMYTYGRWCMEVAKLSWMEKKIATMIFDKPPEATYNDAIEKFQRVNELKPNWRAVSFYIGKCQANLKNYKEAIKAFDAAAALETKDEEDKLINDELTASVKKYASYR